MFNFNSDKTKNYAERERDYHLYAASGGVGEKADEKKCIEEKNQRFIIYRVFYALLIQHQQKT